jgi:hypothetical protein
VHALLCKSRYPQVCAVYVCGFKWWVSFRIRSLGPQGEHVLQALSGKPRYPQVSAVKGGWVCVVGVHRSIGP